MEKSLRVLGGEDEGHGHSHAHGHATESAAGVSSAVATPSKDGLRSRKGGDAPATTPSEEKVTATSKLSLVRTLPPAVSHSVIEPSAYLNLFGDFVHNITDGLA